MDEDLSDTENLRKSNFSVSDEASWINDRICSDKKVKNNQNLKEKILKIIQFNKNDGYEVKIIIKVVPLFSALS